MSDASLTSTAVEYVGRFGEVFAVFDRDQDSGHVAYGVASGHRRYFVKTAGGPQPSQAGTSHAERVSMLRRAALIHEVSHPALVELVDVVTVADGVTLVYEWFDGELLGAPPAGRDDPEEAHNRFARLPVETLATALDQVIDLHVRLEQAGWVAGDFYDGCLMYDFDAEQIKVIDFEYYRIGSYRNDVGRLPGSTRFMAPQESKRGAEITPATTVFNLARMVEIFALHDHELPALADLTARSTENDPNERPRNVAAFQEQWRRARP